MMIEQYTEGRHMTIGGRRYGQDLKIVDGRVRSDWWRREGHRLDLDDIRDVLDARPRILVVGTGYAGNLRVSGRVRSGLGKRRIEVIAERTSRAVETFNRLHAEGRKVAGAFHLTC